MAENTKITKVEWADHTFNPWEGCQKVGAGCDNCYAETRNACFAGGAAINWGAGAPRRRTTEANWKLPLKWDKQAQAKGVRYRVFCSSLADVFDNAVDPQWRADLLALIDKTPYLDWLLLTKRIGNAAKMLDQAEMILFDRFTNYRPRKNIWLGATVVNQEEADRDIPKLIFLRAEKRFLSMEPLLGLVDLTRWIKPAGLHSQLGPSNPGIDWVIVGGESGTNARPMHPEWIKSLRNQCQDSGTPFLFKQWGEWAPHTLRACGDLGGLMRKDKARILHAVGNLEGYFRKGDVFVEKVGKKKGGRLLDGVQWDGVPV